MIGSYTLIVISNLLLKNYLEPFQQKGKTESSFLKMILLEVLTYLE